MGWRAVADDGQYRIDRYHAADDEGHQQQTEEGQQQGGYEIEQRAQRSRQGQAPEARPCPGLYVRLGGHEARSEEHTSELPSLMRTSYAVFCFKKKEQINYTHTQAH